MQTTSDNLPEKKKAPDIEEAILKDALGSAVQRTGYLQTTHLPPVEGMTTAKMAQISSELGIPPVVDNEVYNENELVDKSVEIDWNRDVYDSDGNLISRTKITEMDRRIGMLRQWLNEDRITDPNKMVTNEQIKGWLAPENPSLKDVTKRTYE